jgi:NADH-quinone oxidoreductase subunit E
LRTLPNFHTLHGHNFEEIMLPSQSYRKPDSGAVLAALHEITARCGYLPQDEIRKAASELGVSLAQMVSAATFYSAFSFKPGGKHKIHVCDGTACHVKGSSALIAELEGKLGVGENETTADGNFTLRGVRCLGSCGLAPALSVDGETFGRLSVDALDEILAKYAEAKS